MSYRIRSVWWLLTIVWLSQSYCGARPVLLDGGNDGGDGASGRDAVATNDASLTRHDGASMDAVTHVSTQQGVVIGTADHKTRRFFGIPYAAAPIGELRWRKPQTPAAWSTPRDAKKLSAHCPQPSGGVLSPSGNADEDCLYLNVWTPVPVPKRAPVMVWIHGGAFSLGTGNDALYDGSRMAEQQNAIVVTLNYRLGSLGFLSHPDFPESANLGLVDQQFALSWVRDNIAAFGGDPDNVTIWGESAGGISVCAQLVMPTSAGLFHRAIIESGPCTYKLPTKSEAEQQGQKLAAALLCVDPNDRVTCLRKKLATQVVNALPLKAGVIFGEGASWGPIMDGVVIPQQPVDALTKGAQAKVPVLLGANRDEGTLFVYLANLALITKVQYAGIVAQVYPGNAEAILNAYPPSNYSGGGAALADVIGDAGFVCPTRKMARLIAGGSSKTYLYYFSHPPDFSAAAWLGAYHAAEIAFVFGNAPKNTSGFSSAELKLVTNMMTAWGGFARDGQLEQFGDVTWPAFTAKADNWMTIGLPTSQISSVKSAKCDLWDSIP